MNKALCVAAAVALALSSTAFAKGSSKHRAQAQPATDAQISMSDCNTLSVESARNDCTRWVQAHGGASADTSAQTSVGATGSTSGGMTQGGKIRAKASAVRERAANMRDRALSRLPARSSADATSTSESGPAPQR